MIHVFAGELRGTVQILHDLAKSTDEIPSDSVIVPLSSHPSKSEVQNMASHGLSLIADWRHHAVTNNADQKVIQTLNQAEQSFQRIENWETFPVEQE